MVLAEPGQFMKLSKLQVDEAAGADEFFVYRLFDGAAIGSAAQRDILDADLALENFAVCADNKIVRNDNACDYSFAQPPRRFDHPLVFARNRVFREHDTGTRGLDHPLHDDLERWLEIVRTIEALARARPALFENPFDHLDADDIVLKLLRS